MYERPNRATLNDHNDSEGGGGFRAASPLNAATIRACEYALMKLRS